MLFKEFGMETTKGQKLNKRKQLNVLNALEACCLNASMSIVAFDRGYRVDIHLKMYINKKNYIKGEACKLKIL